MASGSRRGSTLCCGVRMKSSNVQPRTSSSTIAPRSASIGGKAAIARHVVADRHAHRHRTATRRAGVSAEQAAHNTHAARGDRSDAARTAGRHAARRRRADALRAGSRGARAGARVSFRPMRATAAALLLLYPARSGVAIPLTVRASDAGAPCRADQPARRRDRSRRDARAGGAARSLGGNRHRSRSGPRARRADAGPRAGERLHAASDRRRHRLPAARSRRRQARSTRSSRSGSRICATRRESGPGTHVREGVAIEYPYLRSRRAPRLGGDGDGARGVHSVAALTISERRLGR